MANQKLLFLQMTDDYKETAKHIQKTCDFFNIDFNLEVIESPKHLGGYLKAKESRYDYIYVGAHGNDKGIQVCDKKETFMRYADLASSICGSPALAEETILYLGCCEGGFERGALSMMVNCGNITKIAGCECVISPKDAAIAFHNFLYLKDKDNSNNRISKLITDILQKSFNLYSRSNYDLDIAKFIEYVFCYENAIVLLHEDYFPDWRLLEINSKKEENLNLPEQDNVTLVPA